MLLLLVGSFLGFLTLIASLRVARRFAARRLDQPMNVDLSVADAHRMLQKGTITPEEFERLKQVIFERRAERERAAAAERALMPPVGRGGGHAFEVIQNPPSPPPPTDDRDAR